VILREEGSPHMEVRFTRDWRRVRCLDPDADTGLLEAMETELRRRLSSEPDRKLMRILEESLSLGVQMTEAKAYLAESIPAGVEELMRLYVDPPPREKLPRLGGRAAIQARMRSEFEHAGVWDLLIKRIAAAEYTRPGDPLRIDLGYRPNGIIRMFHAVSLEPGLEMAKVLAFSAGALRAGVERVEKAELELTAVIEPAAKLGATDEEPERLAMYRFGVETMEEHRIRVLTTSDLGRVAETARRELRV
jgi:DNA-binding transcriptional MerR regulator